MNVRESMLKLFPHPSNEFIKTCQRIEDDVNYKPDIDPEELLTLVLDKNKQPKYEQTTKATAIIPVPKEFIPTAEDQQPAGALYIGAFARYCHQGGGWLGSWAWGIDTNLIFVDRKGEATILMNQYGDARIDLNKVDIWRKLDAFLNQACLHQNENPVIQPNKIIQFK